MTAPASDPFNLQRFVDAQAPVFSRVLAELRAGRKRSHWMWFIFPQIAGLGSSPMARYFAISGRAEAEAYLAHPTLYPDDLKFCSSITLFAAVAPGEEVFRAALLKYFAGQPDPATLARL